MKRATLTGWNWDVLAKKRDVSPRRSIGWVSPNPMKLTGKKFYVPTAETNNHGKLPLSQNQHGKGSNCIDVLWRVLSVLSYTFYRQVTDVISVSSIRTLVVRATYLFMERRCGRYRCIYDTSIFECGPYLRLYAKWCVGHLAVPDVILLNPNWTIKIRSCLDATTSR